MELIDSKYLIMVALCGVTFTAGLIVLPKLILYFENSQILDKPNWRSSHSLPTPSSGGISFVFTLLVMLPFLNQSIPLLGIVFAAFLLISIGYIDDRVGLKPKLKFIIQFVGATIVYLSNLRFTSLNGFLGVEEIDSFMSFILTTVFIVAIINAYNLIDGVDGLATGVSVIATLVFSIIFILKGDFLFAIFSFSFLGSLCAFLRFNFNPAKIFMGDAGSLFIGLLMSVFFIRVFSQFNNVQSTVAISTLLFPVIDMVRLFVVRILNKKSPFSADNNHYHHLLIKAGDSHKKVAIIGYVVVLLHSITGYVIGCFFSLTIAFILTITLAFLMYLFIAIKHYQLAKHNCQHLTKTINESKKVNFLLTHFNEK